MDEIHGIRLSGGGKQETKLMSFTDYAKRRGVSPAAVTQYAKTGKIPADCIVMQKGTDGKSRRVVDVEKADKALAENLDPRPHKPGKRTGPEAKLPKGKKRIAQSMAKEMEASGMTLAEAQRRQAIAKAAILQMIAAERGKQTMKRRDCEMQMAQVAKLVTSSLDSAAEHVGSIVGGPEVFRTVELLKKEFNRILENMVREIHGYVEKYKPS